MGRALFLFCLLLSGSAVLDAASWPILRGDLSGQFILRGPGNLPPLRWTLTTHPQAGRNEFGLKVTAAGLDLNVAAVGPDEAGVVQWRIVTGEVDGALWWPRLAAQAEISGLPSDLALTGQLKFTGEGTWSETNWQGTLWTEIAHGSASSLAQKWAVPSFQVTAQLARTAQGFLVQALTLHAAEATVAGVNLRQLTLEAAGDAQGRLLVQTAGVDALGGRIALKPFAVDPLNPEVDTTAEMAGVSLAQLATLVPEALREASGQVSGRVAVKWSASLGPQAGTGALTVMPESPANFRLAATPGFLTQHTPERIQLVPATWGVIGRWLSFANPAYETLRQIELGELPLRIEDLNIELYPDGPAGPRSAAVRVTARPAQGSVVEQVTFAINVSGPLDQVLRLGTNERVKLNFGAKP